MQNNIKELKGAISLIAQFEDDKTIDNLICHAINNGLDIEMYDETENDYLMSQEI